MPGYKLSLQSYTSPGFYREAPETWERRLRDVSPILPDVDHLVFRFRDGMHPNDGNGSWPDEEARTHGLWMLYSAKPIRLVEKERAAQFAKHWSELPLHPEADYPEGEQVARRQVVSDYQHFMWHTRGLYVRPFLILQGPFGGTPAKYTEQERAYLQNSHLQDDPMDIGSLPPCPFDERVVQQIARRDRLVQMGNDMGALADMDSADGLGREFAEAEMIGRQTYLDTMKILLEPAVELYKRIYTTKSFGAQAENQGLPNAPDNLSQTIAGWQERFLETGQKTTGATPASQKRVSILVH